MKYPAILQKFDQTQNQSTWDRKQISIGSQIELGIKIQEGDKSRIQNYRGVVISKKNKSYGTSIRVRKCFQKIGVERMFLLNSPNIATLKIIKPTRLKKSKLYFMRNGIVRSSTIKS